MDQISRRPTSSWRGYLDAFATLLVIVTCGALLWRAFPGTSQPATRPPGEVQVPVLPVSIAEAVLKGSDRAPVVMVEYSEFQCPFCGTFARETLPDIDRTYIAPGRVQLAFMHFPLEQIHPLAMDAAEAANCAGAQGRFWDLHDALFQQPRLDPTTIDVSVASISLDRARFDACRAGDVEGAIRRAVVTARTLGIGGTPTFFFGTREADGRVRVTRRFSGAKPFTEFRAAIDPLLDGQP